MKVWALVTTALLVLPHQVVGVDLARGTGSLAVESVLTFDEAGAKERPVTKVINLLKDMLKQLEKEAEEDEEIYDKMACWCETNDKEKTQAIADAQDRIAMLVIKVKELSAASARLATEIKNLESEVQVNIESLTKATSIREKELAEFNEEEKDMIESLSALKAAILVLSKHHASFLQMPHSHIMGVAASVQNEMQKHADLLKGVLTSSQRKVISSFVQAPQDFFDAAPTMGDQSYRPASGQIFGILTQMKETFEKNLAETQKEEAANQKSYEELKYAKETEIATGKNTVDKKTEEKAEVDQKLAQAKEDIEDTKASLSADEQFLMMLKEKCSMTDAEWEDRQKTRAAEIEAVTKALAMLSTDDAHDLFTRTFNPSFVQTGSSLESVRRTDASKLLAAVADKTNNPRLAALSVSVRLDAFTKVKKAIDDMIADLLKQKEDEIKLKDYCVEEFHQNDMETQAKEREKSDLEAKISQLEQTISDLSDAIAALKAEIAELQKAIKKAGEERDAANKEFQMTVADQRATQKLLTKALEVLAGFYLKKDGSALMQQKQTGKASPPPPPGFTGYRNSQGSGGVMSLIQQIIDDAKAMEKATIRSEKEAQEAFEAFVEDTNASIDAKNKAIVNKEDDKAKAEQDLTDSKENLDGVELELEQLANSKIELKQQCDFTLKNFDIRQTARDQEVDALRQAKAILSGADFKAFLQRA